jgi:dipeptidyl aminopeptidase/acylaminoacyl peptidase
MTKLILFALSLVPNWALLAEEIPVESFGHLPVIEQPTVSPDGIYVAAILNTGELPVVVVGKFGSTDLQAILQLEAIDDRIEWIQWANEDRLLVSASFSSYFGGELYRFNRLYAVDRDGQNLQPLNNRTALDQRAFDWAVDTDQLLSILPDDRDHILLQAYDRLDDGNAVFKVNINDNEFDKQFVNSYGVQFWYADTNGAVRLGVGYDKDVRNTWYFNAETEEWEKLYSRKVFEGETFTAVAIDGDKAIVESDHELGRNALWQFDIPTGEFEMLLFAADGYDVDHAIMNVDRTRVIGAAYAEHYQQRHYFDEADTQINSLVSDAFPQYQTFVASRSRDGKRLIVAAVRDDASTRYFWLDLNSKQGGAWFSQYPYLKDVSLSKVTPFEFAARDGTPLSGYITLPATTEGDAAPLIVFPHGGPWSRDYRYFDPYVQFFASRGFAVLQVNFRGSSGFGSDFEQLGYREWGQAMQLDIYDAIDWVEQQDLVDTGRACVVGVSYGGYVALTAAFQRPRQFDCIVSIAGASNLVDSVESFARNETLRVYARKGIGDPRNANQKKMLIDNSPVFHVDEIVSPVLLVHGDHDTQVRVKQSREFYGAARAAGVDIEYVEMDSGTHYFDENKNRLTLFRTLDRFLKEHLQGD